jgi:hypothetical protein
MVTWDIFAVPFDMNTIDPDLHWDVGNSELAITQWFNGVFGYRVGPCQRWNNACKVSKNLRAELMKMF